MQMPWVPLTSSIEYPTALHAEITRAALTTKQREKILELLNKVSRIHNVALQLESRVRELEADNLRLKHENEFMLRLVNNLNYAQQFKSAVPLGIRCNA